MRTLQQNCLFYIHILILCFLTPWVYADSTSDELWVEQFLQEKVDMIYEALQDEEMLEQEKADIILNTADELVDFSLMAKLSLGKKHWKKMSAEQRDEYVPLFVSRMRGLYLKTFFNYSGERVTVEAAKKYKATRISVASYVINGVDKIEMLYKFYRADAGDWKVYDVLVDGVSIVQTQRSQFQEVLNSSTVAMFLEQLKAENGVVDHDEENNGGDEMGEEQ